MQQKEESLLLDACIMAGKILMENGAEMARVEDTMNRILDVNHGTNEATSFVIPTGIFVTSRFGNSTVMKRIVSRTQNMEKIVAVNDASRAFVQEDIDVETFHSRIHTIQKETPDFPQWLRIVSAGLVSACMMLIFEGSFKDFIPTFAIGLLGYTIYLWIARTIKVRFVQEFVSCFIMASLANYLYSIGLIVRLDTTIIGSIVVLVPGLQIMNSIRDFFVGNTISGTVFMIEATLIAGMIGAGVMAAVRF